jgi:hypothetical protein
MVTKTLDDFRAYLVRDRAMDEINLIACPELRIAKDLAAVGTVQRSSEGIAMNLEVAPAVRAVARSAEEAAFRGNG